MRARRVLIVGANLAILAIFWPLIHEPESSDASVLAAYRHVSVSSPNFAPLAVQQELARPLFRAKAPLPEDDKPVSDVGLSPNVRLLGTVLTEERQIAVLEHNGATILVEEGNDMNGWQVVTIEPRKIRLEKLEQNFDVLLDAPEQPH